MIKETTRNAAFKRFYKHCNESGVWTNGYYKDYNTARVYTLLSGPVMVWTEAEKVPEYIKEDKQHIERVNDPYTEYKDLYKRMEDLKKGYFERPEADYDGKIFLALADLITYRYKNRVKDKLTILDINGRLFNIDLLIDVMKMTGREYATLYYDGPTRPGYMDLGAVICPLYVRDHTSVIIVKAA